MKPKEKAIELRNKFIEATKVPNIKKVWVEDLDGAKQCALICVDEILNASPSLPILSDGGGFGDDINLSTEWWQEVKQEIENL